MNVNFENLVEIVAKNWSCLLWSVFKVGIIKINKSPESLNLEFIDILEIIK